MAPKRVLVVIQTNYIPWKGYFDMINMADELVLYDTVQFTKNDWRNRNKLKSPKGPVWITIPVEHHFGQAIQDTRISDPNWAAKHWQTVVQYYSKAHCFRQYRERIEDLYRGCSSPMLSEINERFLTAIFDVLGIRTRITWSRDYDLPEDRNDRLISLCRAVGATDYLSGPAAREYIDEDLFAREGVNLAYMDYSGYPEYRQLFGAFEHGVSVLDLILNEGTELPRFMKSFV